MTGKLYLTLCGAPILMLGDQLLTGVLTGKALALLSFLAVTGRPHHRDALANLLWSDRPLPQARANLRYLLPDLRQVVGDYLLITPQTIAFNRAAPYWLDVEVARTTLTAPRHTVSQIEVQAALRLLQNEFLASFQVRKASAFMNWVAEQRHSLHLLTQQVQQIVVPSSHNLPGQFTPFLGREQEIGEILCFLRKADYRLLSIIGEGGVGKTRLALAVAQRILDSGVLPADQQKAQSQNRLTEQALLGREQLEFPDGVWFVSLVGITTTIDLANQLAMVIGREIGFTFSGQSAPTTQIFHYLATKRLLLILDNFEQLCDEPTFVIELLQKTRAVRLLVTSRRRLNIQAEYPWFITGLPLPCLETAAMLTPAELLQFAGIALFVERARRAQPDFAINGANQATIIQICQAMQGLPLGIELAAALGKEYTCPELVAALYQDYTILATALPDFADRHRSIKRVIDHSWHFLKVEEHTVLSRCAIFRGRFDLEAAAVVAGATPALLTRLYDQSLLHLAGEVAGCRYYVLHELVRQYALEQLTPVALQQVREQHATYFMAKLQQVEATIRHQGINQQLLQCDLDNIRTAWDWSVTQGPLCLLEQVSPRG